MSKCQNETNPDISTSFIYAYAPAYALTYSSADKPDISSHLFSVYTIAYADAYNLIDGM